MYAFIDRGRFCYRKFCQELWSSFRTLENRSAQHYHKSSGRGRYISKLLTCC